MTHEELQAIRELVNSSTDESQWVMVRDIWPLWNVLTSHNKQVVAEHMFGSTAEFIAWCREGVPKLLDYINELENMPLIQTVKHLQEENKQLLEFVAWVDEHIMWGNSDGRCIDAKAKARHILEGESHANL